MLCSSFTEYYHSTIRFDGWKIFTGKNIIPRNIKLSPHETKIWRGQAMTIQHYSPYHPQSYVLFLLFYWLRSLYIHMCFSQPSNSTSIPSLPSCQVHVFSFIQPLIPLSPDCVCMHACMGAWAASKKTESPFPTQNSQDLLNKGWDSIGSSRIDSVTLPSLTMYRSCTCGHSCHESMWTTALTCPPNTVSVQTPTTSGS